MPSELKVDIIKNKKRARRVGRASGPVHVIASTEVHSVRASTGRKAPLRPQFIDLEETDLVWDEPLTNRWAGRGRFLVFGMLGLLCLWAGIGYLLWFLH